LAHLSTPRHAGHHDLGHAIGIDGEHPGGVLGFLPGVERVDQIEPGPRHRHVRAGLALGERRLDHAQALIESEPGCARVPGQHIVLLDRRVEAQPERRGAGHLAGEHPTTY